MVYVYVLFSTKQGTMLHLAFHFNIVSTHINIDADNLEKSDTHVREVFFPILSQIFLTITGMLSKVPLVASVQVQKVTRMRPSLPLHTRKNSPQHSIIRIKLLALTQKSQGLQPTTEEIKGIPRDFVR